MNRPDFTPALRAALQAFLAWNDKDQDTGQLEDALENARRLVAATDPARPLEHPAEIVLEGRRYFRTGKTGTNVKTSEPAAEYSCHADGMEYRAWHRLPSGQIDAD